MDYSILMYTVHTQLARTNMINMGFDLFTTFSEEKGDFNRFQQQKRAVPALPTVETNHLIEFAYKKGQLHDCSFKGSSHFPELDR